MAFTCPLHGWHSYETPCPACQTTVSTAGDLPIPIQPQPAEKEERKFSLDEALEIWECGYDRGLTDEADRGVHLGDHNDDTFNWLDKKTYFKTKFNIDL